MSARQRYSPEFKAEAVKMYRETGLSQSEIAQRLDIPSGTLGHWIEKDAKSPAAGDGTESVQSELQRLRRENNELKMERDILKKATAYFAKESLPGTRS